MAAGFQRLEDSFRVGTKAAGPFAVNAGSSYCLQASCGCRLPFLRHSTAIDTISTENVDDDFVSLAAEWPPLVSASSHSQSAC